MTELLLRLERYFDTVPREHARVEQVGPFTLFVGDPDGWTFYARPRLVPEDAAGSRPLGYDAGSVWTALDRLRELGLPPAIEWVHEVTPGLLEALRAQEDVTIEEIPLMVLGSPRPVSPPADVSVHVLGPEDLDDLAQARAVTELAFAEPGTQKGPAGTGERDAALRPVGSDLPELIGRGKVGWVVARHHIHGVVASGRHLPVGDTTEVVGVATLPAFRRQGLAAAVTDALVAHALGSGLRTVLLTASSPAVARLYAGLGFERVGTGYAAEVTDPASVMPASG